jgi:hypothetical protein
MRLIYSKEKFVHTYKSSFYDLKIENKTVYTVTMVEFPPTKRVIRFNLKNGQTHKIYVPLPYVQFGLVQPGVGANSFVTVTVTTKPYNPLDKLYNLPLPNHNDGAICFGNNAIKLNSIEHCANTFWLSPFGMDYSDNFLLFSSSNDFISNKWRTINPKILEACQKRWAKTNPLNLKYLPNSRYVNIFKNTPDM